MRGGKTSKTSTYYDDLCHYELRRCVEREGEKMRGRQRKGESALIQATNHEVKVAFPAHVILSLSTVPGPPPEPLPLRMKSSAAYDISPHILIPPDGCTPQKHIITLIYSTMSLPPFQALQSCLPEYILQ